MPHTLYTCKYSFVFTGNQNLKKTAFSNTFSIGFQNENAVENVYL